MAKNTTIPQILNQTSLDGIVLDTPPNTDLYFTNRYGERNSPEETIEWLVYHGDPGMAPIIDRGAPSPTYKGGGISMIQAKGALISEKISISEEDANKCLTADPIKRQAAELVLLEKVEDLIARNNLRKEWLASQIFFNGGVVSYKDKFGTRFTIDFNIPQANKVTLASDLKWGTGANRAVLKDVSHMQKTIKTSGGSLSKVMMTSTTLNEKLRDDKNIQELIKQSAFPMKNNLFTQTAAVFSEFLGIPLETYDETISLMVTIVRVIDSTHFQVDDVTGLKPGTDIWFTRVSADQEELIETSKIKTVDPLTNIIETETMVSGSYIPNQDIIQCSVPFLPDNRVVFCAEQVKGKDIVEWVNSPVGLEANRYGIRTKSWAVEDPDCILTRAQNMGLWTLKFPKALAHIDV